MSKVEFEGLGENAACVETRLKIYRMLGNLTPRNVDKTRAEINGHLLKCESCRTFFEEKVEEKVRKNVV